MKKHIRSETFRADVFKNLGYFFASLIGLVIMRITFFNDNLINYFNLKGFLLISSFLASYYFIIKAFTIHERLDIIEEKEDAK